MRSLVIGYVGRGGEENENEMEIMDTLVLCFFFFFTILKIINLF